MLLTHSRFRVSHSLPACTQRKQERERERERDREGEIERGRGREGEQEVFLSAWGAEERERK